MCKIERDVGFIFDNQDGGVIEQDFSGARINY
jgi:hypothetical protein